MNENISTMVNILFDNKQLIKDNDYIVLMDNLKELSKFRPKLFKYKHRVSYKIVTDLCFIEDLSQFDNIKKDLFDNNSHYYNDSEEEFNEDYERVKHVETDGWFYCNSDEIISYETHSDNEIRKLIGEARKYTPNYYLDPEIHQEHIRNVIEYYEMYKKNWDEWIRIKNINLDTIIIENVKYVIPNLQLG